jgi:hypothetical protein
LSALCLKERRRLPCTPSRWLAAGRSTHRREMMSSWSTRRLQCSAEAVLCLPAIQPKPTLIRCRAWVQQQRYSFLLLLLGSFSSSSSASRLLLRRAPRSLALSFSRSLSTYLMPMRRCGFTFPLSKTCLLLVLPARILSSTRKLFVDHLRKEAAPSPCARAPSQVGGWSETIL